MSHVVTITTEVRDAAALTAACRRLGLAEPVRKQVQLFSAEATGHCVALPDWKYPVVCDLTAGEVLFDNFEGSWGERQELDRLLQFYAVEKAKIEARRQGHAVTEHAMEDGSLKLTINVGGTA